MHPWFKSNDGFSGPGKQAGLPRRKVLSWQTNLLSIIVGVTGKGKRSTGLTRLALILVVLTTHFESFSGLPYEGRVVLNSTKACQKGLLWCIQHILRKPNGGGYGALNLCGENMEMQERYVG